MVTADSARPTLRTAALLLLMSLIVAGCADSARPAVDEWRSQWLNVVGELPELAEVSAAAPTELCANAVAMLRSRSPDLIPTPDLAIDDTVKEWIKIAEDTYFECPPRSGEINSFVKAYAELDRLEAEVAVVLELDE